MFRTRYLTHTYNEWLPSVWDLISDYIPQWPGRHRNGIDAVSIIKRVRKELKEMERQRMQQRSQRRRLQRSSVRWA